MCEFGTLLIVVSRYHIRVYVKNGTAADVSPYAIRVYVYFCFFRKKVAFTLDTPRGEPARLAETKRNPAAFRGEGL